MKRRRLEAEKESWEEFEKRVGNKRNNAKKPAVGKVPSDILVQRMSSTASGRLKKYEPLDTRDFVPFEDYEELNLENIKEACEKFYNAPAGSCDILASDRGPSCSKFEQIKGRKVFFIRFLEPKENADRTFRAPEASFERTPARPKSAPASPSRVKRVTTPTVVPKSVSIAQLLRAGTLVKPLKTTTLQLEHFDVESNKWVPACSINLQIQEEPFSSGAFRDAFKATCSDTGLSGQWVVKKYQPTSVKTIVDILNSTVEDHTRKQVQMHAVARNITQRFSARVPIPFGDTFSYGKVFYSVLDELPVTVEEFVPGEFQKYVNNDGTCYAPVTEDHQEVYAKAECLVHFSYAFSEKKMLLVDLQGSMFKLYDPEIATSQFTSDTDESYFCAGNLSHVSIDNFFKEHECNKYCELMGLKD